jgi:hypothetical protein
MPALSTYHRFDESKKSHEGFKSHIVSNTWNYHHKLIHNMIFAWFKSYSSTTRPQASIARVKFWNFVLVCLSPRLKASQLPTCLIGWVHSLLTHLVSPIFREKHFVSPSTSTDCQSHKQPNSRLTTVPGICTNGRKNCTWLNIL